MSIKLWSCFLILLITITNSLMYNTFNTILVFESTYMQTSKLNIGTSRNDAQALPARKHKQRHPTILNNEKMQFIIEKAWIDCSITACQFNFFTK